MKPPDHAALPDIVRAGHRAAPTRPTSPLLALDADGCRGVVVAAIVAALGVTGLVTGLTSDSPLDDRLTGAGAFLLVLGMVASIQETAKATRRVRRRIEVAAALALPDPDIERTVLRVGARGLEPGVREVRAACEAHRSAGRHYEATFWLRVLDRLLRLRTGSGSLTLASLEDELRAAGRDRPRVG